MHDKLFEALAKSTFRSRFKLKDKDKDYISQKGIDTIKLHARDFIAKRIAPAEIPNDGKQTPMRGHPVFIAQHATATCCRGCLEKWHHISKNKNMTDDDIKYVVDIIMSWIEKEYNNYKKTT